MRRLLTVILALLLPVAAVACSDMPDTTSAAGLAKPTKIKVGYMPIPDCAPLFVAIQRDYFKDEGLEVETVPVQGGGVAQPMLESGALDFAIMNYTAAILAEQSKPGVMRVVSDAYQSAPHTFKLMVRADSPIHKLQDIRRKTVAVATLKSVGTLTLQAALEVAGLTMRDVQVKEMELPHMILALQRRTIDVAWMTEPFITIWASQHGGRELYELMQGRVEDWPIAGWATGGEYAERFPDRVAAFQRAMNRAQIDVETEPRLVHDLLPTYTKIPKDLAQTIKVGVFPRTLEPARIQKVADLMQEYGDTKGRVDVQRILMPLPGTAPMSPSPSATTPEPTP